MVEMRCASANVGGALEEARAGPADEFAVRCAEPQALRANCRAVDLGCAEGQHGRAIHEGKDVGHSEARNGRIFFKKAKFCHGGSLSVDSDCLQFEIPT